MFGASTKAMWKKLDSLYMPGILGEQQGQQCMSRLDRARCHSTRRPVPS